MKTLKNFSQSDINGITDFLSHEIQPWSPTIIVSLAKGGLIPARLIARKLNISKIISFGISFYDNTDTKTKKPEIYQNFDGCSFNNEDRVLIVDDIADSGESVLICKSELIKLGIRNIKTCCLFMKPKSKITPDHYFDIVDDNCWVVFFWE